ncbi:hypothetical protein [Clostridium hydrogenum]|uniref:hypothetical protein n=1 Tax=Clostridium hydrogenum TaxID=2855764 RepID=UPI001F1DBC98|nr:hypothetical protein [Clostridium hydrogenum]
MNKKLVAMITSLAVGGTLLLGTSFVSASQLSGYQSFKTTVKDTKDLKNGTINLQLTATDNGTSIINVNSNLKLNLSVNAMNSVTTVKSGNATETFNNYEQDGKTINKDSSSNQYTVQESHHRKSNKITKIQNPEIAKSIEVVLDTLVGSMQNKVSIVTNADGTKTDSINLTSSDITPLANALTSIALISNNAEISNLSTLKTAIPQLQSNVKLESITSSGNINKNDVLTNQTATITLSGDDANGKQHNIQVTVKLALSNINHTTPDRVNLNGKQVKTVAPRFEEKAK